MVHKARSNIHLSFDLWSSPSYLAIAAIVAYCCRAALTYLGISGLATLLHLGNPLLRHISYIQPRTTPIQLGYRKFSLDELSFSSDGPSSLLQMDM
jgi:hypothetical protein